MPTVTQIMSSVMYYTNAAENNTRCVTHMTYEAFSGMEYMPYIMILKYVFFFYCINNPLKYYLSFTTH